MQKLVITIKEEIKRGSRGESVGAIPMAPHAYAPSIIAGLDPPPTSKPENSLALTHESHSLSPLQRAMQQAQRAGETVLGFSATFPVFEDANQRYHEALPFKQLKKLKIACAQYGPMAPFAQAMIENLGGQNLPPNDWKQIVRACLSGGDIRPYILPNLPVNLWGRDVMTHMGVYLYSPSEQVSNQLLDFLGLGNTTREMSHPSNLGDCLIKVDLDIFRRDL